ncbi:MAG: FG-GAP repeat protein [Omnitrophica WOR_2 bacterium]
MNRKWIVLLFVLGLLAGACTLLKPTKSLAPLTTPALKPAAPLPEPMAVLSALKLQHKPGPDTVWNYGQSIALGEGVLAVGAPHWGGQPGQKAGVVFVYQRQGNQWVEQAQLSAADKDDGFQYDQQIGYSLALEKNILFAGAPYADDRKAGDNTGAVYVFQKGVEGWAQIDRLAAAEPAANASFGHTLVSSGDWLAVSEVIPGMRVFLFQQQVGKWRQRALLEMPVVDGYKGNLYAIDLYGDTLVVTVVYTRGENEMTQGFSRVYLYELQAGGWQQASVLSFGEENGGSKRIVSGSVALDGSQGRAERLALNVMNLTASYGSGAVLIYERAASGWQLKDRLTAPDSQNTDGFGGSLDLKGNILLVGAPGASEDSFWDGVAYAFELDHGRWVEQLRLAPPEDGGFGDFFGSRLAVQESTFLISAPNEFGNAVYVFEVGKGH